MLTYSLSLNKLISIPSLKKIVSAKIVEFLWNATPFVPEDPDGAWESEYWDDALTKHREQTISACNAFAEDNNLPSIFKTDFKESVYSLCRAYSQLLRWKTIYDPNDQLGDLKANLLVARNYLTVDGEFDDLAWIKRVVLDPVYPIKCRFCLACNYCLENETAVLWSELENKHLVPFNGNLSDIRHPLIFSFNVLHPRVLVRIFQLENNPNRRFASRAYEVLFKEAALKDCEYATRFFWEKMAEPAKIMEGESFFNLINYSQEKIAVFLYSQLSKEQKQKYLDWSVKKGSYKCVILLLSPHTEAEHSGIIEFIYKLPIHQYSYVLAEIAGGIKKHSLAFHCEGMFKILWTHLSSEKRGQVLEVCPSIIETLIKSNRFDIVVYVMKGLSRAQKEKYFSANALEVGNRLAAF